MKKILIIGGTHFLGRNLLERLMGKPKKYDLTLFNRGKTNPDLFTEVKRIKGDRETDDIEKITKHNWDVIIDISGYFPNSLNRLLDLVKGKVGRYVYVSTCSAMQFDLKSNTPLTENHPLRLCSEEQKIDPTFVSYNEKKAECERVLLSKDWLDKIILRPGLVIGQYDYTDRMYYWFYKMQTQKKLLVANKGAQLLAYSDVRDFAKIMEKSIDHNPGFTTYNVTSYNASIQSFLKGIHNYYKEPKQIVSASSEFLVEHQVKERRSLPLWFDGNYYTINNSRVKKDFDFTPTPIENSIQHLFDYYSNNLKWRPYNLPNAITSEREAELINLI